MNHYLSLLLGEPRSVSLTLCASDEVSVRELLRHYGSAQARPALESQSRKRTRAYQPTHKSNAVGMSVWPWNLQKCVNVADGRDKLGHKGQELRFKLYFPRLKFGDALEHVSYIIARKRVNPCSSRKLIT